jgi:two-component system, sensor histidine kinase and response regulator
MKGDLERCLAAGMDDYLTKPLDSPQLYAMVERMADPTPDAQEQKRAAPAISEQVLARVGGDHELLAEISRLFVEDAPVHLQRIRAAIDARDAGALRSAAHALKGAAGLFDANQVVEHAHILEEMGRSAALDGVEAVWRDFAVHLDHLLNTLRVLAA